MNERRDRRPRRQRNRWTRSKARGARGRVKPSSAGVEPQQTASPEHRRKHRPGCRNTAARRRPRRDVPDKRARAVNVDPVRRFLRDQPIEGGHRLEQGSDRLLLVKIELGEPPERVAAVGKPPPHRQAADIQAPQVLDPRDRAFRRAFGLRGIEIGRELHATLAAAAAGQAEDGVNHAVAWFADWCWREI